MGDFVYRFEGIIKIPALDPHAVESVRIKRQIRLLDRMIYGIIDRRRRGPLDGNDLLTRLMQAREPGRGNPAPAAR